MSSQANLATDWRAGYGPIAHRSETIERMQALVQRLVAQRRIADEASAHALLAAADRVACTAMSVVAHMTYARRIDRSGCPLGSDDFKQTPEGHTGGSLNMVPAFVGYLLANALTGTTRGWLMGQGHCVAAIEAVNALTGDVSAAQRGRYDRSEAGLSRLIADFYSYAIDKQGRPAVPLGSHAGPNTAGAISEGGYLGFAGLQYVHTPLPGESLVAFLSDGAFEEHRGSDWAPRWWRAEDCGVALPVLIANGRRIEQRTELGTAVGRAGFVEHLRHCGFDPLCFDGRDPAAFVCALFSMEQHLTHRLDELARGILHYPLPLPYGIAEAPKGFGFYGAGSNAAHNLPLPGNPQCDEASRQLFNAAAAALWVAPPALDAALARFAALRGGRPAERDHPLAARRPELPQIPALPFESAARSPMRAVDRFFVALVAANPQLRARVGNPDELASNHLDEVLRKLRHRVCAPENDGEALDGKVITALNEEAVVAACLGNQGGLNLVASYEAFCVKMLGALRQTLLFARQQRQLGRPAGWLGWPLVATSHTWENGKNQQSHQDPTCCEALLGEMADGVRVAFPADYNSTLALLPGIYRSRGQLACLVVPRHERPCLFDAAQAAQLAEEGALLVAEQGGGELLLIACGSYQLSEMLRAAERLAQAGHGYRLVYLQEPGRFRAPRDTLEESVVAGPELRERLFPRARSRRVLLGHLRPEVARGHLWPLLADAERSVALGFINRGGTFDVAGMLFANRATWAHVLEACAGLLGLAAASLLDNDELAALAGTGDPRVLR